MRVKITKAKGYASWYRDLIGESFEVEEDPKDKRYWKLLQQVDLHKIKVILKEDCVVVPD